MQFSLTVAAHSSTAGHRGTDSTLAALKEEYIWTYMRDDCATFIRQYLHCLVVKGEGKIPRQLSTGVHGIHPNYVIHFDYQFMGLGQEDMKYDLVIKHEITFYTWLCTSPTADAEQIASELNHWIRTFTLMNTCVSDQGSHFKNKVIQVLSHGFNINHHFTVAYSPWINGTVENVMQHILGCCKAMLAEFKLSPQDLPLVTAW